MTEDMSINTNEKKPRRPYYSKARRNSTLKSKKTAGQENMEKETKENVNSISKEIVASNMHRYKNPIKNIVHQLYCTLKGIKGKYNKSRLQDKFVFQLKNKTVRDADVIIATAWPTAYKVSKLDKSKIQCFAA